LLIPLFRLVLAQKWSVHLIEEQNKIIEKMQGQINMMLQGIMERDKRYFEREYPHLRKQVAGSESKDK